MMSALEKRLDALKQQRQALDDKIRAVEREKATALRKIREQKIRLIGRVVLAAIEAGQAVNLESEGDLVSLLDERLIAKSDRAAFGLDERFSEASEKGDMREPDLPASEREAALSERVVEEKAEEISEELETEASVSAPPAKTPRSQVKTSKRTKAQKTKENPKSPTQASDSDILNGSAAGISKASQNPKSSASLPRQQFASSQKTSKRLPVSSSQKDILDEFNL